MLIKSVLLTALAAVFSIVEAGQGLNINVCIYQQVTPIEPYMAKFVGGGANNRCMIPEHSGNFRASLRSDRGGLTCMGLGYIERKASSSGGDICNSRYSYWGLGFTLDPKSVSVILQFWAGWAGLSNAPAGTYLCTSPHMCYGTETYFSDHGPLYIIWDPNYSTGKSVHGAHRPPRIEEEATLAREVEIYEQVEQK